MTEAIGARVVLDDGAVMGLKIWTRQGTLKCFKEEGMVCGADQLEELKGIADKMRCVGLHGWLDSASTYNAIAGDVVRQTGVCFVGVDFIGHGFSSHLPKKQGVVYSIVDHFFYTTELLRKIGWDRFHIVGHSMGAVISCMIASAMPQQVLSVLSIESLGPWPERTDISSFADRYQRVNQSIRSISAKSVKVYESRKAAAAARVQGLEKFYGGTQRISFEACWELTERCCVALNPQDPEDRRVVFSHDPTLRQDTMFYLAEQQCQALIDVQCPFAVIFGSQGLINPFWLQRVEKLKQEGKNIKVYHVDGFHHLHLENPKPIVQIATSLLQSKSKL